MLVVSNVTPRQRDAEGLATILIENFVGEFEG